MVDADLSAALSLAAFVVFTALLTIGALSTLIRALRYVHAAQPWPKLLIRDLICFGGLGFDFLLILGVRFAGIGPSLAGNLAWVIITSAIAIAAVGTYVYFELFVIEQPIDKKKAP